MTGSGSTAGIERYEFTDRLHEDHGAASTEISNWYGHDRVLDRRVLIRVVHGPRRSVVLAAARRAATVEDQRLTRVLDVLDNVTALPIDTGVMDSESAHGAYTVVVSEWAQGRTVPELLAARGQPLAIDTVLSILDAASGALVTATLAGVSHGRLTADHLVVDDAGTVRVRGLATDAALFGAWPEGGGPAASVDVEALARIMYLMLTGIELPVIVADSLDPPSWLNPAVPRELDSVVTEVLDGSFRTRWRRPDVRDFRSALGFTGAASRKGSDPALRRMALTGRRVAGVLAAMTAVGALITLGAVLLSIGQPLSQQGDPQDATVLTSPVVVPSADASAPAERVLSISRIRSFDPFDDDDGNGRPDGRKGRENNAEAVRAADGDAATRWTSKTYRADDADGKGGVGLVLELTEPALVQSVDLDFGQVGTGVEVKLGDDLWPDPDLWTTFASAPAGEATISIRGARPVKAKYVLLWFPEVPQTPEDPERFQVRVAEVSVRGE